MGVEQLDVDQRQPAGRQRPLGGQHRVVLEVLVVDRVELGALHQREQVLHLDRYPAVVRDERPQALGEPDDVRDVGVDVVQADQVGRPVLGADLRPGLRREERRQRRHALRPRGLADVHRRLDPQAPDAALRDVLQQVAVVARHLDDERRRPEPETLDGRVDEPPRVLHPERGERREVGVLGERLLRRDQRRQLGQQAGLAHPDVQRVGQLRALQRASAVRNSSHGGVAPRSTKLRSRADPHSRQVIAGAAAGTSVAGAVSVSTRAPSLDVIRGRRCPRAGPSADGDRSSGVPR